MNNKKFISYLKFNGLRGSEYSNDKIRIRVYGMTILYDTKKKEIYVVEPNGIPLDVLSKICNVINEYNNVSNFFGTLDDMKVMSPLFSIFKTSEKDRNEDNFENYVLNYYDKKHRKNHVKLIKGVFIDVRGLSLKNKIKTVIENDTELDTVTKSNYLRLVDKKCK